MNSFMGIDPGSSSGGIAVVGSIEDAFPLPETERETWDLICGLKANLNIAFACIESVHSMPKQGVASSFKFGRSYGFLRGLLIASNIYFDDITPQVWQKIMGCRTGGDKNISKSKAKGLFPQLRVTHRTADALLIAATARILWRNAHPGDPEIKPKPQFLFNPLEVI